VPLLKFVDFIPQNSTSIATVPWCKQNRTNENFIIFLSEKYVRFKIQFLKEKPYFIWPELSNSFHQDVWSKPEIWKVLEKSRTRSLLERQRQILVEKLIDIKDLKNSQKVLEKIHRTSLNHFVVTPVYINWLLSLRIKYNANNPCHVMGFPKFGTLKPRLVPWKI